MILFFWVLHAWCHVFVDPDFIGNVAIFPLDINQWIQNPKPWNMLSTQVWRKGSGNLLFLGCSTFGRTKCGGTGKGWRNPNVRLQADELPPDQLNANTFAERPASGAAAPATAAATGPAPAAATSGAGGAAPAAAPAAVPAAGAAAAAAGTASGGCTCSSIRATVAAGPSQEKRCCWQECGRTPWRHAASASWFLARVDGVSIAEQADGDDEVTWQ